MYRRLQYPYVGEGGWCWWCIPACTEADIPPTVDRILDTRLWKYYLAATSLRTVKTMAVWCITLGSAYSEFAYNEQISLHQNYWQQYVKIQLQRAPAYQDQLHISIRCKRDSLQLTFANLPMTKSLWTLLACLVIIWWCLHVSIDLCTYLGRWAENASHHFDLAAR